MFASTLEYLRCPGSGRVRGKVPICGSRLELQAERTEKGGDVLFGSLSCPSCRSQFPILGGVAVLVRDVRGYLLEHVKGVSRVVPESQFPKALARELKAAKAALRAGHIEDDLEAERVISLYAMNHYLSVQDALAPWWKSTSGKPSSELIEKLILDHWDRGPLEQVAGWIRERSAMADVVEIGCGVGGLARRLGARKGRYLGVDSSFASIALARQLLLGGPVSGPLRIPQDLLDGPVSLEVGVDVRLPPQANVDFVVGEMERSPVAQAAWDLTVALNAIDMLENPSSLPEAQWSFLKPTGMAIQSCPYIWHESVARKLRARLPKNLKSSSRAVEWLYECAGFAIESREEHLPWLFFKHYRQLEIYSVHWFVAKRVSRGSVA